MAAAAPAIDDAALSKLPPHRRPKGPKSVPNWLFYLFLLAFALEYSGLPNAFPVLKAFRVTTILTYLALILTISQVGIGDLFKHRQGKMLLWFLIFTICSMAWAVVKLKAYQSIRPFVDYLFLFYLMANHLDRPKRMQTFGVLVSFLMIYLVQQNLSRMGQDLRIGSYAAAYFMGDGNDFAWGMAVMLPFAFYLVLTSKSFIVKLIGVAGLGVGVFGIIGTSSRGGTLGIGAAILFYWYFMAKRKALGAGMVVALVLAVLALAPGSYLNRMGGIANTTEDSSAQARIETWKASLKMAIDYPLGVGAGNFSSAYGRYYMTGSAALGSAANRWFSAHSIYFRTVGEYGYFGAGLLIWLIISAIIDNMRARKALIELGDKAPIPVTWPAFVAMALVAYAACGIFLGGLSYPHLFMLCGLTVANKRLAGMAPVPPKKLPGRARGRVAAATATASTTGDRT